MQTHIIKQNITYHRSDKLTSSSGSSMRALISSYVLGRINVFSNIFEKYDQGSMQLDCSFSIVLNKYWEYCSHVVVVPEDHLGELDASKWGCR